jgi:hypothetical protein
VAPNLQLRQAMLNKQMYLSMSLIACGCWLAACDHGENVELRVQVRNDKGAIIGEPFIRASAGETSEIQWSSSALDIGLVAKMSPASTELCHVVSVKQRAADFSVETNVTICEGAPVMFPGHDGLPGVVLTTKHY